VRSQPRHNGREIKSPFSAHESSEQIEIDVYIEKEQCIRKRLYEKSNFRPLSRFFLLALHASHLWAK
jgi:hypothetical protein